MHLLLGGGGADEIRTYERNFVAKSICSTAKGMAKREGEAKVGCTSVIETKNSFFVSYYARFALLLLLRGESRRRLGNSSKKLCFSLGISLALHYFCKSIT